MRKLHVAITNWITPMFSKLDKGLLAFQRGNYALALKCWQPLAEKGVAEAQYNLGMMYANGLGVRRDEQEATRLFRLAADQGLALAQSRLEESYRNGSIDPQDDTEAIKWLRLAAEQGNAKAKINLQEMQAEESPEGERCNPQGFGKQVSG